MWADKIKSENDSLEESDSLDGFQLVKSKKRKKSTNSSLNNINLNTSNNKDNKKATLFGTGINCTLKSSKVIENKATYYVGNVGPCNKDIIENHLKANDISYNHCFPVFRKKASENSSTAENLTKDSTAFKIILPLSQLPKLINPDIWPMYTFLREWDFSYRKKLDVKDKKEKVLSNHGVEQQQ